MPDVLIAGGGSGGHIFPGLAIAERLAEVEPEAAALFVCSERAIDHRILQEAGAAFVPIPARPWSPRPRGLLAFIHAQPACRRALRPLFEDGGVRHVLAMGGFVAAPVVAAANRHGVPTTLVNLDATPGKANRWLARRCTRVVSAVATVPGFAERITGMPIRRRAACTVEPVSCRRALDLSDDLRTLIVVGGSQGATSVNAFAAAFAGAERGRLEGWQVLHLCGDGDGDRDLRAAYERAGIPAVVMPFCDRMDLAWGAADLAVSRAGASSVAEAAVNRVPTLFLPYPFHRDRHQWGNARPLVDDDAAAIAEDRVDPRANLEHVGPVLSELIESDTRRSAMRRALDDRSERGTADAASEIARLVLSDR